jgi:hypothetical protein
VGIDARFAESALWLRLDPRCRGSCHPVGHRWLAYLDSDLEIGLPTRAIRPDQLR